MSASKCRLAILDDYQHVGFKCADWTGIEPRLDVTVFDDTIQASTDADALIKRLEPFEIICTMRERTKFPADILNRLPNLKLLTTTAMGNRSIDMKAAEDEGILVAGTGYIATGTAEHNWTLIMAVARGLVHDHDNTVNKRPQWQIRVPMELSGKTLGILGLGNLGKTTAKYGQVFGMKVQAWSPHLTPERAKEAGVAFATKEEFFRSSDIISIHMVAAPSTFDLVASEEFALMKPTAFLVNTSRGPIVNEDALLKALNEERIAGAGLDVFNIEPLPLDSPVRSAKNVTLTPHMGYVGDTLYKVFWQDTVNNVAAYLDAEPNKIKLITQLDWDSSRAGKSSL